MRKIIILLIPRMTLSVFYGLTIAISFGLMGLATAQPVVREVAPDAGRILETINQVPTPDFGSPKQPEIDSTRPTRPAISGQSSVSFDVTGFKITGNTVIDTADIQNNLKVLVGKKLNLDQLRAAADQIGDYYRSKGYFIARAYIPAQQITNGIVEIQVIEGRRGEVITQTTGEPIVKHSVLIGYIDAAVPANAVVSEAELERALLLLSDTPGVSNVKSSLEPGSVVGTSNINLSTTSGPRFFGSLDVDNFGSRYSGTNRIGITAGVNSLTGFGDQLTFRGQTTGTEGMQQGGQTNYGRISYLIPIGSDGLKVGAAYSAMNYKLGLDFQNTDTNGSANTANVFATYPVVRSRNFNLYGQVGYDNLQMKNNSQGFVISNKSVNNASVGLSGNSRDNYLGGGLNNFGFAATLGNLGLENSTGYSSLDALTANTAGSFQRYNFNLSRLQAVTNSMHFVVNATAQLASKNLDSSQQFYLGGPSGVRAYPVGQGAGSQGALMQLELHQKILDNSPIGAITAYGFYDIGTVQLFKNTWNNWNQPNPRTGQALSQNTTLQGAGIGFKATINDRFYLNLTWARTIGTSQSVNVYGSNVNGLNQSNTFWLQGVLQY